MHTRIRVAALGAVLALLATALVAAGTAAAQETETTTEPATTETEPTTAPTTTDRYRAERLRIVRKIRALRQETWRWQRLMRVPLTRPTRVADRSESLAYQRWALRAWRQKARKMRRRAHSPTRLEAWLCIHRHEGAWNANTGNGYYGGLQMDVQFQRTYGADLLRRKGLAHRWGYLEQIWVAERAYRSGRGFYPWPNTARSCGLV